MKAKKLIQPAIPMMKGIPSKSAYDVSPHSSAIVGVTMLGDLEDVLAVLRTAVVLARNLRATLFLGLSGKDVFPVHFGEAAYSTLVAEVLDSAGAQLRGLGAPFAMEVNIVAASFISEGAITMRVRSTNTALRHRQA